jgi:geranylgeranyl diphosphate synthase, type I
VITTLPAALGRARALVTPALREAVARLAPEVRLPAEYHLGWVDRDGQPTDAGGGKHVRAALVLLSAQAVGADERVAIPGAVAMELTHNFSLLHDDVIDDDRERRHRLTVWATFGVGHAITTGDALAILALQTLLDGGGRHAREAASVLTAATARMIAGETADIELETRDDVSLVDAMAMSGGKTGALLECAASLGAVLAGAPAPQVERLAEYGYQLGLAFQAVDDVLGIWGDPEVTGKPVWSDLRQSKKTIPIVAALAHADGDAPALRGLLSRSRRSERSAAAAAELIERWRGREVAEELAQEHLDLALRSLRAAAVVPEAEAELVELARFVVERQQ